MRPVLATEGELHQTASRAASQQCVEANSAGAVASNDGKQTNDGGILIGVQYSTLLLGHLDPEYT
jgi:hypothetical protein